MWKPKQIGKKSINVFCGNKKKTKYFVEKGNVMR